MGDSNFSCYSIEYFPREEYRPDDADSTNAIPCKFTGSVLSPYIYWVTQKLPQICTVILRIRIGKVAWFAVYICGNFWVTQYFMIKVISKIQVIKIGLKMYCVILLVIQMTENLS